MHKDINQCEQPPIHETWIKDLQTIINDLEKKITYIFISVEIFFGLVGLISDLHGWIWTRYALVRLISDLHGCMYMPFMH